MLSGWRHRASTGSWCWLNDGFFEGAQFVLSVGIEPDDNVRLGPVFGPWQGKPTGAPNGRAHGSNRPVLTPNFVNSCDLPALRREADLCENIPRRFHWTTCGARRGIRTPTPFGIGF